MAARPFMADDLDELLCFVVERDSNDLGISASPEEIGEIAREMLEFFDRSEFVEFDVEAGVFRNIHVGG